MNFENEARNVGLEPDKMINYTDDRPIKEIVKEILNNPEVIIKKYFPDDREIVK